MTSHNSNSAHSSSSSSSNNPRAGILHHNSATHVERRRIFIPNDDDERHPVRSQSLRQVATGAQQQATRRAVTLTLSSQRIMRDDSVRSFDAAAAAPWNTARFPLHCSPLADGRRSCSEGAASVAASGMTTARSSPSPTTRQSSLRSSTFRRSALNDSSSLPRRRLAVPGEAERGADSSAAQHPNCLHRNAELAARDDSKWPTAPHNNNNGQRSLESASSSMDDQRLMEEAQEEEIL